MSPRPLLLGHRGVRGAGGLVSRKQRLPAENTLAAFEYAISHGCDGVELDARSTRDGRIILCHDPKLKGRAVVDTTFHELCTDCGFRLPCLEDVLEQFGHRAYLDIELKESGYEERVVAALRAFSPSLGFLLSSFRPQVLDVLHQLDSSLPLGFIYDEPDSSQLWRGLPVRAIVPQHGYIDDSLMQEARRSGMQVFAWTVNREPDVRRMHEFGVDGIISDDPAMLRRMFP